MMSERKLACIKTIKAKEAIEKSDGTKYDNIVLCSFNESNWRVIGNKDLQIGEKVVYLEIDSIIPEVILNQMTESVSNTLKKRSWSQKYNGILIRTMKMGTSISQGIIFSYKDVQNFFKEQEWNTIKPGTDVTEHLSIRKRGDEDSDEGKNIKEPQFFRKWKWLLWKFFKIKKSTGPSWVSFIDKTDETRVQAFSEENFNSWKGRIISITEKLDGQSYTSAIYKGYFYICSRNMCKIKIPLKKAIKLFNPTTEAKQTDRFIQMACKYDIPRKMHKYRPNWNWAIQAEQLGPGIQSNRYNLKDTQLFLFNIKNLDDNCYYKSSTVKMIAEKLNIPSVPLLSVEKIFDFENVEALEKYSEGESSIYKTEREGIVIRADIKVPYMWYPMPKPEKGMSNMWSIKSISKKYLLEIDKKEK